MLRRALAIGLLAAVAFSAPAGAGQNPTSRSLLELASRYLATFVDRFSNVVAEERYVQDWKTNAGLTLMHRESRSDFLLTRVLDTNSWQAFRDVFEVDGEPVRNREDRLTKLFMEPSASSRDQAASIAAESTRYNISNVQRTVNHPLFVLAFLQPANQSHFAYSVDKRDREFGDNVWIVEYKETARPTFIRGTNNRDLPAHGRIWINATTGSIARTELELEDNLQSGHIVALFQSDGTLPIEVPVEMQEQYSVKGLAGKVSGKATYGRFREWRVKTEEALKETR